MKSVNKKLLIILPILIIIVCAVAFIFYYENKPSSDFSLIMSKAVYTDSSGKKIPYRLYSPQSSESQNFPLVIYLHGAGTNGNNNKKQVQNNTFLEVLFSEENLEKYPCFVLVPQCPEDERWVDGPDDQVNVEVELKELIEKIKGEYSVDSSRIYLTGVSMGGFGTWGLLRDYPDYFTAAIPVCGGWDLPGDIEKAPLMKNVPIWVFHGAKDTAVPVERSRDMVKALEDAGGKVKYTEYPEEEHSIAGRVYHEAELLPWLFSQIKS